MKYRKLAGGTLEVPAIGFSLRDVGTHLGRRLTEGEAGRLLHRAVDLGVTLIESAASYGEGSAQELLAGRLRSERDQLVLAVKVGQSTQPAFLREAGVDLSAAAVRRATEDALRRLHTDRLDVLILQDLSTEAVADDALWETLAGLRKEGKILHAGAALGPGAGWTEEATQCLRLRKPTVIEHLHNPLEFAAGQAIYAAAQEGIDAAARAEATGLVPAVMEGGEGTQAPGIAARFFVRGPFASGLLDGSLNQKSVFPPEDPRAKLPAEWLTQGLAKARRLEFLTGRETGRTAAQAALLWVLAEPLVASCLVSVTDEARLMEVALAPEGNALSREELQRVAELQADNFGFENAAPAPGPGRAG